MDKVVLGIDMDDVTAKLNEKALELYNIDNGSKILTMDDLHCWDANWDILSKYYMKEGIYESLEVEEGSQDVLRRLSEDFHVLFVTASPSIEATREKMLWVDRHFPFVGHQNVIATRYKYLVNADVLFDDSPSFLPKFPGVRVLMDRVHNQTLTEQDFDYRVTNWYDFEDLVLDLNKENLLFTN